MQAGLGEAGPHPPPEAGNSASTRVSWLSEKVIKSDIRVIHPQNLSNIQFLDRMC
jgi:hypothetical protein